MGTLGPDLQDDGLIEKVPDWTINSFLMLIILLSALPDLSLLLLLLQRAQKERIKEYSRNLRHQNAYETDYSKFQ